MDAMEVDGTWVFTPRIHSDRRGSFVEWFGQSELCDHVGRRMAVAQASCSTPERGVVRGIDFAEVPPGQAKCVRSISEAVLDVIVDIRIGSSG